MRYRNVLIIKWIIEISIFWPILCAIFKNSTWGALGPQPLLSNSSNHPLSVKSVITNLLQKNIWSDIFHPFMRRNKLTIVMFVSKNSYQKRLMNIILIMYIRAVVSGGAGGALASPEFGSSVNPIPTRGGRLFPSHHC